jgi:pimeloyl-ACP methyl ester carboxylesterase
MSLSPSEHGKSIQAMGLATNYHDMGSGDPIILLHGSGPGVSGWANWGRIMPTLAQRFRVIAPDLAGYGYTQLDSSAQYTMDYWLQHLHEFIDALGLTKVSLVGNSFGGALATNFNLRYPGRIKRAVVMAGPVCTFKVTPALHMAWGYSNPTPASMRELLTVFASNPNIISDELIQLRHEASNRPGYREAYESMFPLNKRQDTLDAWGLCDEQFRSFENEWLFLHGLDDVIVPADVSLRAARSIPRSQAHFFSRCGHWIMVEQADRFCRALLDFFSEK